MLIAAKFSSNEIFGWAAILKVYDILIQLALYNFKVPF